MSLRPASAPVGAPRRKHRLEHVLRAGLEKDVGVRGGVGPYQGAVPPYAPRGPALLVPNVNKGRGDPDLLVPSERLGELQERLYGGSGLYGALPKTLESNGPGGRYHYERIYHTVAGEEVTDYVLRSANLDGGPVGGRVEFAGEPGKEQAVRWSGPGGWIDLHGARGAEKITEMELDGATMAKIGKAFPAAGEDTQKSIVQVNQLVSVVDTADTSVRSILYKERTDNVRSLVVDAKEPRSREEMNSLLEADRKMVVARERLVRYLATRDEVLGRLKVSIKRGVSTFEYDKGDGSTLIFYPNADDTEPVVKRVGGFGKTWRRDDIAPLSTAIDEAYQLTIEMAQIHDDINRMVDAFQEKERARREELRAKAARERAEQRLADEREEEALLRELERENAVERDELARQQKKYKAFLDKIARQNALADQQAQRDNADTTRAGFDFPLARYATGMFDMYQTVKTCGLLAAIMGCDPEEEPGPLLDEEGNEDTQDDPVAFFKFSNALVVKGGDRYNVYTDPTQFLSNAALKREQVRLARRYNKEEYNRVQ